jgi:hypothetical protein
MRDRATEGRQWSGWGGGGPMTVGEGSPMAGVRGEKKTNFALYHVENPNPNGVVLKDQDLSLTYYTGVQL